MRPHSFRQIFIFSLTAAVMLGANAFAADRLTCESFKGKRVYCDVGGARGSDIELSHQLSDTDCKEGESWGSDSRGVWVDNGCRAEFTVYRHRNDSHGDDSRRDDSRRDDWRRDDHYGSRRDDRDAERCPAGFVSGNHRCSSDERRRGCKDMRMPGGTTCNSSGWSR